MVGFTRKGMLFLRYLREPSGLDKQSNRYQFKGQELYFQWQQASEAFEPLLDKITSMQLFVAQNAQLESSLNRFQNSIEVSVPDAPSSRFSGTFT